MNLSEKVIMISIYGKLSDENMNNIINDFSK